MNVLGLLKEIDQIINKYEDTWYDCESYFLAQRGLWSCTQGPEVSDVDYLNKMKARVETVENYGISIGNDLCLLKAHEDYKELDVNEEGRTINHVHAHQVLMNKVKQDTKDRVLGYLYLKNACKI